MDTAIREAVTRGDVNEKFTDKHNLCILNDGTHTYLKPQAQHMNNPMSAIDLTIPTPGLALRSAWEVLPDTHRGDYKTILTSIAPSMAEIRPSCDSYQLLFSKADWDQFHDQCIEGVTKDISKEAGPLNSFPKHITKVTNDSSLRATAIP